MSLSGSVSSGPVLAVQVWIAWPAAAQVQSPIVSLSIMPQGLAALADQLTLGGGGGSWALT